MRNKLLTAALLGSAIMASPVEAKKAPALTPMELQALQSREYKTSKDQVFSSVVTVFQDLGYQINSADVASGLVTAASANKNKTSFFEAWAGVRSSGGSRVTAFIETMPSGLTRARLNFLNTKNSSSWYGSSTSNDKPILDPKTYQVAFEHIEEALFERGALTKTAPAIPAAATPTIAPAAVVAPTTATPAVTPAAVTTPGPAAISAAPASGTAAVAPAANAEPPK